MITMKIDVERSVKLSARAGDDPEDRGRHRSKIDIEDDGSVYISLRDLERVPAQSRLSRNHSFLRSENCTTAKSCASFR